MTNPVTRWPWGSGPAPALCCDECGKRIGKPRTHFITASENLLCARCMMPNRGGSTHLHAKYYPGCPDHWHGMFDHGLTHATRAGAWFARAEQADK
jgi:hypothetical protein